MPLQFHVLPYGRHPLTVVLPTISRTSSPLDPGDRYLQTVTQRSEKEVSE